MKQLQKLTNPEDSKVKVKSLVTPLEIADRNKDYVKISDREYATKHSKGLAFRDIILSIGEETHNIQLNVCINPFCRNFGLPQHRYKDIKYQPSRYKIESGEGAHKFICNDVKTPNEDGIIIKNKPRTLSNWSAAEEIKRLIDVNSITPVAPEYTFHRNDCTLDTNPFDNPEMFRRRGKSSSNSEKFQCKECDKITNVMPSQRESYSYH